MEQRGTTRARLVGDLHGEVGVQQLLDHLVHVLLLEERAAAPVRRRRRRGSHAHAGIARGRGRAREHGARRGGVGLATARLLRGLHGREVEAVELGDELGGEGRRRRVVGRGRGVARREVSAHARAAHDARRLVVGARRALGRLEGAQPDPRLPVEIRERFAMVRSRSHQEPIDRAKGRHG
jgi:hypothetical protein